MATMSARAIWLPPRRHPMLRTDMCHGAVGNERPRNGRRAPIADALAIEIQLNVVISPRETGRKTRKQTHVFLPLCIAASAWATAGTCSARATASRHIKGGRQQNGITSQSGHVYTPLAPRTRVRAGATVAMRDGGGREWGRRSSCPIDRRRAERRLRRRGGRVGRRRGATGGSALIVRSRRSRHSTMPARTRPSCSKQLLHSATKLGHLAAQCRVLAAHFGETLAKLGHHLRLSVHAGIVRLPLQERQDTMGARTQPPNSPISGRATAAGRPWRGRTGDGRGRPRCGPPSRPAPQSPRTPPPRTRPPRARTAPSARPAPPAAPPTRTAQGTARPSPQ